MITSQANVVINDAGGVKRGSKYPENTAKLAASAFMNISKGDEDDDDSGKMPDQRRINEIFVRLRVAEMSSLYFVFLGILLGIFDYEISYDDSNDSDKTTRIISEAL